MTARAATKGSWVARATVAMIAVSVGLPLLALVVWSFTFRWMFPDVLPSQWGGNAWSYTLSESSRVFEGLGNSLVIGVIVTALALLIGLPASRALGLSTFRGKSLVEWILMMPIIVPAIVATMGIHVFFIRLGLANTLIGVALVHLIPTIPYFVLVMASVFANYGTELEETARTLGAGPVQVFLHVTLPAVGPGLLVASMFTFLVSWSQYVTTLLIGGGRTITLPLVLFPFIAGANHTVAAAISLVFVAPAILVLVFTARNLSRDAAIMGGFGRL
jgi:putative spermidine/putrescine transport system permease protein